MVRYTKRVQEHLDNLTFRSEVRRALDKYNSGDYGTIDVYDREHNRLRRKKNYQHLEKGVVLARYKTCREEIVIKRKEDGDVWVMFCSEHVIQNGEKQE